MAFKYTLTSESGQTLPNVSSGAFLSATLPSGFTFARASAGWDVVNGTLTSYATDAPRINTTNGLLLEEQRTNICTQSAAAPGANGAGTTVTAVSNNMTGANDAYQITTTAGTSVTGCTNANVTGTVGNQTASVFVKAGTIRYLQLYCGVSGVTDQTANFDLQTKTVTRVGSGCAAWIEVYPNDWFRLSLYHWTSGVHGGLSLRILQTGAEAQNPVLTYTGTETFTCALFQDEMGYGATSYIPTSGAAVTRAAETLLVTNPAAIPYAEGAALFVGTAPVYHNAGAAISFRLLKLINAAGFFTIMKNATDRKLRLSSNGLANAADALSSGVIADGAQTKAALRWKLNDYAISRSGEAAVADTTADVLASAFTAIQVGYDTSPSTGYWNGRIRDVAFHPWGKNNAELQGMTT